jgi:hypothetical protein
MVGLGAKVDPHRSTIDVPEGSFRVYREDDRFMVGRIPDGSLLGFFQLDLTDSGHIVVRPHLTGQLGLGTRDEASELLELIGRLAVDHGIVGG